jgi:hypothetical protein
MPSKTSSEELNISQSQPMEIEIEGIASSPTPTTRHGKPLNHQEQRLLIESCLSYVDDWSNGTSYHVFWSKVSGEFQLASMQDYSVTFCQQIIITLVEKRKTFLQAHKTGKTQDPYSYICEELDRWIIVVDSQAANCAATCEALNQ